MHTDEQLLAFNNAVAHRGAVIWWEMHHSAPGHDQDELFLQFTDGSVVRISAEHREHGAALKVEPARCLPAGRLTRNLPEEYNARAVADRLAAPPPLVEQERKTE
jgi:hypothetical protein